MYDLYVFRYTYDKYIYIHDIYIYDIYIYVFKFTKTCEQRFVLVHRWTCWRDFWTIVTSMNNFQDSNEVTRWPISKEPGMTWMTEQVSEVFGNDVVDDLKVGVRFRCLLFLPLPGDMIQFEEHIFQMSWNHQLGWLFASIGLSILLIKRNGCDFFWGSPNYREAQFDWEEERNKLRTRLHLFFVLRCLTCPWWCHPVSLATFFFHSDMWV